MTEISEPCAGKGIVCLLGGVGGAKLALGLSRLVSANDLTMVVNTGDDFQHLGLSISPDLDTVMYVLAGLDDSEKGWGRREETWTFMRAAEALGMESWFALGDADLATHIERTRRLQSGEALSSVTADLCRKFGIKHTILPMSDDSVRTFVETDSESLAFQHYFVRERCSPAVQGFRFEGAKTAKPLSTVIKALQSSNLQAVVICPSNPFVSVDPILAVPGLEIEIRRAGVPVVAVSPIVGGTAIKGPAAKMMSELGMPVTATGVVDYYAKRYPKLLSGFVADAVDREHEAETPLGMPFLWTNTVMKTVGDKERLASEVLTFIDELSGVA